MRCEREGGFVPSGVDAKRSRRVPEDTLTHQSEPKANDGPASRSSIVSRVWSTFALRAIVDSLRLKRARRPLGNLLERGSQEAVPNDPDHRLIVSQVSGREGDSHDAHRRHHKLARAFRSKRNESTHIRG
jgi:hypothetical protein